MIYEEYEEGEKIELNLENPIFAFYFDSRNMPISAVDSTIQSVSRFFNRYSNITVWSFAADRTKIDCIWPGGLNDNAIDKIVKSLKRLDTTASNSEIRQQIRDILIEDFVNETK